jgi:hypothetical protein
MGHDLNQSNDDLSFTFLFKRPHRFARDVAYPNPDHLKLFDLHEKMLLGRLPYRVAELSLLLEASRDQLDGPYYGRRWIIERWRKILLPSAPKPQGDLMLWGWKEPHAIFFLHSIQAYYQKTKFILVLRNGLDMAYSRNTQQLKYWGILFGIDPSNLEAQNRFEFWYRSNKHAIATAQGQFGDSFMTVKLEDLCLKKERSLEAIFGFVGLNPANISEDVWQIPRLPASYGRYKEYDTTWINEGVIQKLTEVGYGQ